MLDPERLPPLPGTLEECHREILYLKRELFHARNEWAQQVTERQKERRALKGSIKVLAEETKQLKKELYGNKKQGN